MQATPPPVQPQAPVVSGTRKMFHEQFDDEQIVLLLRKDFWFLIRSMLVEIVIFLGMVALVLLDVFFDLGLIEKNWFWIAWFTALLIIGFWAFIDWFNWRFDLYVITDRRVVDSTRRFPFKKRLAEAQLDRVQDTSYEKDGLFANVFNYGTMVIQTAGESTNFQWEGMPDPVKAQAIVRQAVEEDLRRDAARRQGPGGL